MFKPTADHIEELMRAKEICLSISDEIADEDYGYSLSRGRLDSAAAAIEAVLNQFSNTMKALTP